MENITIDKLIELLETYKQDDVKIIKKAYNYADNLHANQKRDNGDPYIIHPLSVAYILAEMHADTDTICAALLHDTLEDTNFTKEDITENFNQTVANLVDGVTKISKLNFSTKQEQNFANTRKIITSVMNDVRIIIIKLADRLHNMRTLEHKSAKKQQENALETMEIFVPFAYYIGAYRIKSELEDLSLKYLKPDIYHKLAKRKQKIEVDSQDCLSEMLYQITTILNNHQIPHEIKVRTKNIYGIYKRLSAGHKISDIHDLLSLKIMVNEIYTCYQTLYHVHSLYKPINNKFKDYICNPKTNMYHSLHTTVFGPDDRLVQTQIRTFDMDKVASFGLTSYWDKAGDNARDIMQEKLRNQFQFFNSLMEINNIFGDNQDFVNQIKNELFTDKIYVYNNQGHIIELPVGSTPVDFAYEQGDEYGNTLSHATVNGNLVPLNYQLKNKDIVRIFTDELLYGSHHEWLAFVKTSKARRKILEFTD